MLTPLYRKQGGEIYLTKKTYNDVYGFENGELLIKFLCDKFS